MEIEARELRIGNIFLIDGVPQKVLAIVPNGNSTSFVSGDYFNVIYLHHEYKTSYEVYSNEDIEPIQLTDEWLVKFGFEESEFVFSKNMYFIKGLQIWKCNDMFLCDKNGIYIKYVHQLQNLYFALREKELTYEN